MRTDLLMDGHIRCTILTYYY